MIWEPVDKETYRSFKQKCHLRDQCLTLAKIQDYYLKSVQWLNSMANTDTQELLVLPLNSQGRQYLI